MTQKPLSRELELITANMKRQMRGEDVPVISGRQYRRLRSWCKKRLAEIIVAAMYIMLNLADPRPWVFIFATAGGLVIVLWRWYRRDTSRSAGAPRSEEGGSGTCSEHKKKGTA